ncbi:hypothetical protein BIV57_18680 [Mangrovactinospora gilvigrisea]|uniref:Uncharacterized protein n=2 Tax=Mangrovactinospora gilvigrisea TaxID=1428644 RepID=A0A1J7BBK7_9ACTN|nr:hypothetical protein [Mangrovactinospora gilvigrisea]OIV36014.1 hypothetical protein BIV57_18680 [Mangrovactinospora gilvigrisea]
MNVDWNALGIVAGVGIASTVVLVALFCVGIAAWGRREAGSGGAAALTGAVSCFALCAAGVLYGLYLIVPQLHG